MIYVSGHEEILDIVSFIKDHMLTKGKGVTKEEMRELVREEVSGIVQDELRPIQHELRLIQEQFDELSRSVENINGFRKEIDHLWSASPPSKNISG